VPNGCAGAAGELRRRSGRAAAGMRISIDKRLWVKLRRTQCEHKFSGLLLIADIGVWHLRDGSKTPSRFTGVAPSRAIR
jgi:hypothetical protein